MPTFKPVVLRHQKRKTDGKYPVSIRVTHNRKCVYIKTGIYISSSQISRKTFEIKDFHIIERMNRTISDYESYLLSISTSELKSMSVDAIRAALSLFNNSVDYLDYCKKLCAEEPKKWAILKSCLSIITDEMNLNSMPVKLVSVGFIERFKKFLDNRSINGRSMRSTTKNNYLTQMGTAWSCMMRDYNNEYITVVKSNPFSFVRKFDKELIEKRAIGEDELRKIFAYQGENRIGVDAALISFCLCGMNVADMYDAKISCLKNGRVTYKRAKTRGRRADDALISIKVEPEIKELIEKYKGRNGKLFHFRDGKDAAAWTVFFNSRLAKVCKELGIKPVTMYWFRHTWATIARNKCGVSKDDIDLCLDHVGNNKMADFYITEDWSMIDAANRKVLDYVFGSKPE